MKRLNQLRNWYNELLEFMAVRKQFLKENEICYWDDNLYLKMRRALNLLSLRIYSQKSRIKMKRELRQLEKWIPFFALVNHIQKHYSPPKKNKNWICYSGKDGIGGRS